MTVTELTLAAALLFVSLVACAILAACWLQRNDGQDDYLTMLRIQEQIRQYRRIGVTSIRIDILEQIMDDVERGEEEEDGGEDNGGREEARS
jgi:hypothetical protein